MNVMQYSFNYCQILMIIKINENENFYLNPTKTNMVYIYFVITFFFCCISLMLRMNCLDLRMKCT